MQPVGDIGVEPDRREVERVSIGIAFITGSPNRVRTTTTRSGVSRPCSCSMSGLSASMLAASKSSSASTDSATLRGAAAHAGAERPRGLEADMPRRRRKEHEADMVGAGIERDVDRVGRHQAANLDLYGHFASLFCRRGSSAA